MSSIIAINSVTKKYFLPVEIENIIYQYLTIEDYNKPQEYFKKYFLNRVSCESPTLTFFSAILETNMKSKVMNHILNTSKLYLENYNDTDFYSVYIYDDEILVEEDGFIIPAGYYPENINAVDEDEYFVGDNIIHPEGYRNIYKLASNYKLLTN
jgi:hypothetical protein